MEPSNVWVHSPVNSLSHSKTKLSNSSKTTPSLTTVALYFIVFKSICNMLTPSLEVNGASTTL